MPGEICSRGWPLLVPSLWALGGKLPFTVWLLTGEIMGTLVEGDATGAVPIFNRIEEHIFGSITTRSLM